MGAQQFLDWSVARNQNIQRALHEPMPWQFLAGQLPTQGRLLGGCVDTLLSLQTTDLWPDVDTWANIVMFLEASEAGISPSMLADMLREFDRQDILQKIKGLLFGRPGGMASRREALLNMIKLFWKYCMPAIGQIYL